MTTKDDIKRWGDDLWAAAKRSACNVRKLRILAGTFQGNPRDTALALLQYIVIFMRCCGIEKDETAGYFATTLSAGYTVDEPDLPEVYLYRKDYGAN